MSKLSALITSFAISGSIASAVSAIVLGFLAKAEGASPLQPINATSHWLHCLLGMDGILVVDRENWRRQAHIETR